MIVSPIIIGTLRKSEKASFERSIDGLIESVRIDHADDSFNAPREYFYEYSDLTLLTVNEKIKDENVPTHGRIDGNGFLYVDGEGVIHLENVCNKKYCANGPEDNVEITENKDPLPSLDKHDPMISLIGEETVYININGIYVEEGAKARTRVGEKLEYTVEIKKEGNIVENIETSSESTYIVTYTTSNNEKTVSVERKVIVLDMTPQITMSEASENYVKEQEILINVSAIKPNKITEFKYSINGEEKTVKGLNETFRLNETGVYEVKVTVEDNKGNRNTLTKTYKIDHTGPVITFNPEVVEITASEVENYNLLTGVEVTDNIEGIIDNTRVRTEGNLNSIIGEYEITYKVSDSAGNETEKVRIFRVYDGDKPEITITPNEQSSYVQSKTVAISATDNVEVSSLKYVIIKDNVRGEEEIVTGNSTTITLKETGEYKIEVTAIDSNNNSETKTSGIYKIDTTPPTLTIPEDSTINITEVSGYDLLEGVIATDNTGITPTITRKGDLSSTVGSYVITYTAKDEAGNETTATRRITVINVPGPILGLSNETTGGIWTKGQTITGTVSSTVSIKTFTYEVIKDGTSQGLKTVNGNSVGIQLNKTGKYQIKLTATDQYNQETLKTSGEYMIDTTAPSAPTSMEFVYGDWSRYIQNSWTKENVYVANTETQNGPSGASDSHSGIAKYQISKDGSTWVDYVYNSSNEMYKLTTEGTHTRYFRAVDKAGNVSSTISRTAKIDKTAPTAGTASITGTKGSNNWYTSNVSITAVNGSDSLSGHASTTVSVSSITSNTSSTTVTVTTRDKAGNSSTRTYTVKVDKNSPSITVKSTATAEITQGTSVTSSTYFNSPTYSTSGGSMSCSPTNTSGLTVGSRSVTCTAIG